MCMLLFDPFFYSCSLLLISNNDCAIVLQLFRDACISVVEILKLDVVSSTYIPLQVCQQILLSSCNPVFPPLLAIVLFPIDIRRFCNCFFPHLSAIVLLPIYLMHP